MVEDKHHSMFPFSEAGLEPLLPKSFAPKTITHQARRAFSPKCAVLVGASMTAELLERGS
jgi:hypothetical protein